MMHLLLLMAPLAQTLPVRPGPPEGLEQVTLDTPQVDEAQAPEAERPPGAEADPTEADPTEAVEGEGEALPSLEEGEAEVAAPVPWSAPEDDAVRQGQLGPWPDDFQAPAGRLEMLPTVDPVTGRVLDPGTPMEGELEGPQVALPEPPPEAPPEPEAHAQLPEAPSLVPDLSELELEQPEVAAPPAAPLLQTAPAPQLWPFEPPKGGQSFTRSILWFFIATLAVLLGRRLDAAKVSLPKRGLLPAMARAMEVVSRIAALIAGLFGSMRLVPDAYFQYFPVVLVAAAVAVGWSARDVLHDVLAGILLVVEHRLVPDMRVEADGRVGTVISVGFRSVSMESDDGQLIRIPNRDFLSTDTRVDKDPFAPVEVVVEAPHGARRRLEEIALASPLVAPGHPPEVFRDPEHPERWVVRARLVHPRWTLAFRGAVQDRLEAG